MSFSSVIHETATIADTATIGEQCFIGPNVKIGEGCLIGHGVIIHEDTQIGNRVRVDDKVVLGKRPMKAVNSATTTIKPLVPLVIGDDCLIGTAAIIYRGATLAPKCLVADMGGIREDVTVGKATIVGRGAYVENQSTLGCFVKIESMAYVAAYSEIGDRAFVAPMVTITNDNYVGRDKERFKHFKGVTIKRGGRVGANATTLPGAIIEEDALVAAGAVVKYAPAGQISMGQPAKPLRPIDDTQRLENQDWPDVKEP